MKDLYIIGNIYANIRLKISYRQDINNAIPVNSGPTRKNDILVDTIIKNGQLIKLNIDFQNKFACITSI